jgi:hypothetical protein
MLRQRENSKNFDPSIFDLTNEDAVFDRKRQLYLLDDPHSRGELIKDFIALANSMRRRGAPAYLVFGVEDDRKIVKNNEGESIGIWGQFIKSVAPPNWKEDCLDPLQQENKVGRSLLNVIDLHVDPMLDLQYECGFIDDCLVSYIKIPNQISNKWRGKPFQVIKKLEHKNNLIHGIGTCWIRIGSDTKLVDSENQEHLTCYLDVPFVNSGEWRSYLRSVTDEFNKIDETHLPIYAVYAKTNERVLLSEKLQALTISSDPMSFRPPRILVNNLPGCGKTTALQALAKSVAENALLSLDTHSGEPPSTPIPIFVSLRDYSKAHNERLIDFCVSQLQRHGIDMRSKYQPEKIFEDRHLTFVLILDGFDEMIDGSIKENREQHKTFIRQMQHHITITSCRSTQLDSLYTPESSSVQEYFEQISVTNLEYQDILNYFVGLVNDEALARQVIESFEDLCLRPFGFDATKIYLENYTNADQEGDAEAGSLRPLVRWNALNNIVRYTLKRELKKYPLPTYNIPHLAEQELFSSLGELASKQVITNQNETIRSQLPVLLSNKNIVEWLLWTGLVDVSYERYFFRYSLIRDYFAVLHISSCDDRGISIRTKLPQHIRELLDQALGEDQGSSNQ